jgi:gamma-glutamyltranspeptidase/glutathione hydrolase
MPVLAAAPDPVTGERAVVASAHPEASAAGRAMLAAGGNAVDAAVAMSLAISVVEPWGSGLGGGAFAVVHLGGVTASLDMRETAPAAAHADMFVRDGRVVPGESTASARAAAIPGLVRGLVALHARFGRLPFRAVVVPAIALARDGVVVSPRMQAAIAGALPAMNPAARAIFAPAGGAFPVGSRLVQADLAATLERIAATRGEDFYVGETAARLVSAVAAEGGLWTASDLAAYAPRERPVVTGDYRGHTLASMGPPSSGGLLLLQMLGVLSRLPPLPAPDPAAPATWAGEAALHRLAETMKRAFALRALGLGDPDHVPVDHARFLAPATLDRLAREVRLARRATPAARLSPLKVHRADRPDTSHLAVLTADGDAVALTQTINLRFGTGRVAAGTGVLLNNEMDDFSAQPGVPNAFGLVGDAGNAIAPGKRPLSSMTPTLVLREGRAVGAFGSPGGSRIISTTLQCILRVMQDGLDASSALAAPRVHHQWHPDALMVEDTALSPETAQALRRRGHALQPVAPMGNAMILWRRPDGRLEGAADPRGEGAALGL